MERLFVALAASVFAGFGLWLFIDPGALAGIGIELTQPAARIDVRATYGGFELGLASALMYCAYADRWISPALLVSTCAIAGFGLGRLGGIVIEGQGTPLMWTLLAIEVSMTTLLIWAFRRSLKR
jgi:hypothetical protein